MGKGILRISIVGKKKQDRFPFRIKNQDSNHKVLNM